MSTQASPIDVDLAHRFFSAECFNRAWALIDQRARSEAENREMVLAAVASLWHWSQRSDCAEKNLSIGNWQVSRVYALIGSGQEAMRYGEMSLKYSSGLRAYYVGYAHEAIARAAMVLGDKGKADAHLKLARELLGGIDDGDERGQLEKDLGELENGI